MCQHKRKLNRSMQVGLIFLILANTSKWFLRHGIGFPDRFDDFAIGLLFGVSIGCMLLGLRGGCGQREA